MEPRTTSLLRPEPRDRAGHTSGTRRGFTLIEMLVVIGIILVLMGILLPSANRAYKEANRNSMRADLQTIEQALEAYKSDFGDYPRPGKLNGTGAFVGGPETLCWALIAPGPAFSTAVPSDGFDGPGFRLIPGTRANPPQGQVHQPYLNVDRFHYGTLNGIVVTPWAPGAVIDDSKTVIADRNNNVILYYPRNLAAPTPTTMAKYVGPSKNYPPKSTDPVYDTTDFDQSNFNPFVNLQLIQSAIPGSAYLPKIRAITTSPTLSPGEMINNPYLLWSAGPDGIFGPQLNTAKSMTTDQDDDVTNFQ
jgi:type II secretion system protein G